jgi:hypothetical protein
VAESRRNRTDRDDRWARLAAATGVVFVVLALVGFVLAPNPPGPDASNDEVLSYFSDKENALRWQALLFTLGGAALLWFAGTLAAALRRRLEAGSDRTADVRTLDDLGVRWPAIMLAAAGTAVALFTAGTASYTALAARAGEEIDASAGRALFELGGSLITYTSFPTFVFVAAASLAVARTRLLPDWLAWLGGAVALVLAIAGAGAVIGDSETFGPSGFFGIIAFLSNLLWILVASGLLTWKAGDLDREGRARARS